MNDFAIRNMSDSKTIALLERMRQEMDFDSLNVQHQQAKELDRIAFVKSYILLEEFTKEIVAVLQVHALNFYGCYTFDGESA